MMRLIHSGLDVAPILADLYACRGWGAHDERTTRENTAHDETDDLWLRYFPHETLLKPCDFNKPGECVFYPAWRDVPSLHPVVWSLMATLQAVELGGILVTRLPPGGVIKRHSDAGVWHAERFNRKAYVVLAANARCVVECDGVEAVYRPGEIFELNNLLPHGMENGGTTDRITAIICMRSQT